MYVMPLEQREAYVDEADEFYQDMRGFVREVVDGKYGGRIGWWCLRARRRS